MLSTQKAMIEKDLFIYSIYEIVTIQLLCKKKKKAINPIYKVHETSSKVVTDKDTSRIRMAFKATSVCSLLIKPVLKGKVSS